MYSFVRGIFTGGDADDTAEDTRKILRWDADSIGNGRNRHIGGEESAGSFYTDGGEVGVGCAARLFGKEGGKIRTVKPHGTRYAGDSERLVILGFHNTDCLIYVGAVVFRRMLTQKSGEDAVYMCGAAVFCPAVGIVTHRVEVGYRRFDFRKGGGRDEGILGVDACGGEGFTDILADDGTPEAGTGMDGIGDLGDAFARHKDIAVANGDGDFTLCLNNRAAAVNTALEDIMIVDDGAVAGAAWDVLILVYKYETGSIIGFHKTSHNKLMIFSNI